MSDLDPKLTFESFVVGPANRLASAAARRAAESPGTSYNPLFLSSEPGLGKTHILTAIAHRSEKVGQELNVEYMALEEYLDRLEISLKAGNGEKDMYAGLDILLLDDVQFLTGQPEAQEMLLKTLDQLTAAGGQIVLASDRPPADINGLDARLLSRFSGGLSVALAVEEHEDPWIGAVREAIESADRQGLTTLRLDALLEGSKPKNWEQVLDSFKADIQRLHEIDNELQRLGNPWPEAAQGVLEDPDRLEEAEALLTSVRERPRPFYQLGDGPQLHDLVGFEVIAVKAAAQLIGSEKPEYNPLFMWSSDEAVAKTILGAVCRTYQESYPELRTAVGSVSIFASDFIRALSGGVAGAWRERWWTVDLLLIHGIQELVETERAQDEFFHLFEALRRRGARMMFVADCPPSAIQDIDERLRSRFEGGLVLELSTGDVGAFDLFEPDDGVASDDRIFVPALEESDGGARDSATVTQPQLMAVKPGKKGGVWFPGPENVVIHWPRLDELLIEELD